MMLCRHRFVVTVFLCLISTMCFAKDKVIIDGQVIISQPTLYKDVILDLNHGRFVIKNKAKLIIENSIIEGTISNENPYFVAINNGYLEFKNNEVEVSAINIPANPNIASSYMLFKVTAGKVNIAENSFTVDKSYSVGLLSTETAKTAHFEITNNNITNFHGGIFLTNFSDALIQNNQFKNVSLSNIFIADGNQSLINGNIFLFSGNNNVGDAFDVISSDNITLSNNFILSGSCYSIVVLKSKNIAIINNNIIGGITYAIHIISSMNDIDKKDINLSRLLNDMKASRFIHEENQNITITNNYLSQNRYGLSAKNVDGLIVKNNIFIQRFASNEDRKFWTNNKMLLQNVTHLTWAANRYKEAFTQEEEGSNKQSLKFVEFPLSGGG